MAARQGRNAPSHAQTTKTLRRASIREQGWALLGRAWLPSLAHLCITTSYLSSCLSMLPDPWTPCRVLDPLLQQDLWWQWEIFPLLSSLIPSRILPAGAPGAGQHRMLGVLGLRLSMHGPSGPCFWPWSHSPGKSHVPRPAELSQHAGVWVKIWIPSPGAARDRRHAHGP